MMRLIWVASLVALLACTEHPDGGTRTRSAMTPPRTPPHGSAIGTNLAAVRDWSTERPFADLMKQSRPWFSNTEVSWDDGRRIEVDAHGWPKKLAPGQRARTLLMWGPPIPAGEYVATWTGNGKLDFWPQEARVEANRAVIRARPAKGGLALTIVQTDPQNPVRDIHVWSKGSERKEFSLQFLQSLEGYSTLRFMDWMDTNEPKVVKFADRPSLDDARYSEKGVPLEAMVDLCNALGDDLWLNVPDLWDDDAVEKAAVLVRDALDKKLAVYLEHSNEVWNTMFPQAKRARERGMEEGLAKDPYEAQLKKHAARSVGIFEIWERVFGSERERLVRVIASQAVSPYVSGILLSAPRVAQHADALAIAPYVGLDAKVQDLDGVFRGLERNLEQTMELLRQQKALAAKHGLRLLAYEGGQHLVGDDPLFFAANRDPRMKALYTSMLHEWKAAGGGLFMHYLDAAAPTKFGSWGARETVDQPRASAPKLDALLDFVESERGPR